MKEYLDKNYAYKDKKLDEKKFLSDRKVFTDALSYFAKKDFVYAAIISIFSNLLQVNIFNMIK
jgi:hypothetical protein